MRNGILVDTGPLLALVDKSDQYHSRSYSEYEHILENGKFIVLLYPTLLEAYTLIMRHLDLSFAQKWLHQMMDGCSLLNPTTEDYHSAAKLVSQFSDQHITLFDATLGVVASTLELPVWTFDHDLDVIGANVWR